jgi:hypothetical protein
MRIVAENHSTQRVTHIMEPSQHPDMTVRVKSPRSPDALPDGLVISLNGATPYRTGLRENRQYLINLTRDEVQRIVECARDSGLVEAVP